jgi:beta-mannosidase
MKIETLSGEWQFRQVGSEDWHPASVPGGVHLDLMAAGLIPDPFVGDNEQRVQWVAESDWEYRRSFTCSQQLFSHDRIYLVCDGLDTLATLSLNGHELGRAENMFRQYEWEVRSLLKAEGENLLSIVFASPVRYISAKNALREMTAPYHSIAGGPYLRKAPCQFGWDWGPRLPPIGIWKDLHLAGYSEARIAAVHLFQNHQDGQVTVQARVKLDMWSEHDLKVRVNIECPVGLLEANIDQAESAVSSDGDSLVTVLISSPQLWWPNGYGEHPLYNVKVDLVTDTTEPSILDEKEYEIGLRTIALRQQADNWGRSFTFVVNGVPIKAKGSNWIPADSFPTRITSASLESLIESAAQTHQNMLRVWGGGFYEDERFYDLCDRYGLLVWQEFIFSCSIYPLDDPAFLENVHQEVIQNVRRLRHRASLALWCGNNEMEWGWVEWMWDRPDLQDLKDTYDRFFHHTLKDWCLAEDPDHAYWPSSPSSDLPFKNPNGQRQGDSHYWDVWHGGKPFTAYRSQSPRFMSEFGFQSLPPLQTIKTYASEDDWNMTSYIMEQHQKNNNGNAMMIRQMLDLFRLPKDFASLVYLSMVLQAEGIRYGAEHWRRNPAVDGILYWQLNDCWPVASWSSLDYYGRWKALHYAAKRFFAPLLLSIKDEPPRMTVYLTNDLLEPAEGWVAWSLQKLDGSLLVSGEVFVKVEPQSSLLACELDFSAQLTGDLARDVVFVASFAQDHTQLVSRQTATFVPIKHLSLVDPGIQAGFEIAAGQLSITVQSRSLALLIELSLAGADVVFSDNYFSLLAGEPLKITCPLPLGWSLAQARDALRIRSVYHSYAHAQDV